MKGSELQQHANSVLGLVIAGRYRLDRVLGIGGTGVVYQARCLEEERDFAVKTIRKDLAHQRAIARFFRGARLASGLHHSGLISTLAYGQAKGPNGVPFQVMPLVDGPSWAELSVSEMTIAEKTWLICQVLDTLAYVHARGVLHRDIKPANILMSRQSDGILRPLIMDFGISSAFRGDVGDIQLTGANSLVGTPAFMAPEQAKSGAINGPELDLYAVGVMFYLLLSGRLPFRGTPMEMLAAKATSAAQPLEVQGLQPEIVDAVGRLIAREPSHRYALAAQARRAIEQYAQPLRVTDERMARLVVKRSRPVVAPPIVAQWTPPGVETLELAWPTLVFAAPNQGQASHIEGRTSVFSAIDSVVRRVERGDVALVSVLGESGMGKSAILEHVTAQLVEEGRFLVLRAPYFGSGEQGSGVRRGVERMLGVHGMGRQEVREAVQALLARYDDVFPEEVEQLVDCLRPREDMGSEALSARLGEYMMVVARLLRRLSQTRPMLVLIDDAQYASSDLARFLEFILLEARFDRWPMLVLCGVDVTDEQGVYWRSVTQSEVLMSPSHTRIQLHRLSNDVLAKSLMDRHGLSRPQANRIARWSSGNPLHANYLAEYLLESAETAFSGADGSATNTGLRSLPSQLLDLMQLKLAAQLKAAPDVTAVTAVLQALAVLGQASAEDLVQSMLEPEARAVFERTLDTLLQMGLVGIVDHGEPLVIGFTPPLLREAVLGQISQPSLEGFHLRAVEVYSDLRGARRQSNWGALGDHHAALGQMSLASKCWLKGMQYEISTGNVVRGLTWGQQAVALMDPEDPQSAYITLLVATMAFDSGESEMAEGLMRSVMASSNVDRRLQAGDLLCDVMENRGDKQGWADLVEEMGALEEQASDVGRCALYSARSMWLGSVGRFMEGLADAQRALSLATPGPPAQRAAQRLAFACLPQMQLDDALKAAKRSVTEAGDVPLLRARSLRILGLVQLWQHSPKAVDTLQRVPELCRSTGLMTRYPIALHDLGDAYRVSGELQKAREMYQETISLCEGLPLTSTVALCHFKLAMCDILDGQPSERLNRMDDLVAQGLSVGLGQSDRFGAFLCGWAHAKQEKVGSALESLQTAGDLVSLLVDPQMPQIIEEICTALVQRVLTSPDALPHLRGVSSLCRQARDVYGISGDMARLQAVERLLQRLPQVPR